MKNSLVAGVVAVLIVGCLLGGVLFWTRNNHLELKGEVLKVRSFAPDPNQTIAVIDFRLTNPSNNQFVVKDVEVFLDTKDGKTIDGATFPESDAQRVLDYYKNLGPKYNPSLIVRDRVNAGQSADRMIAVRFDVPDQQVIDRKQVRVVVSDVDGAKSEISEKK